MKLYLIGKILLLIIVCTLIAGCSEYTSPELKITSQLTRISDDAQTGEVTYDVAVTITNTGQNNAYKVKTLTILSTPKDLPEYRFININSDIGDIEKESSKTITERMTLKATKENYNLIMSGTRDPEVEITVTSVTSNIMG